MTVSASLVKELRESSGAGMMDCKRALEETGGDLEQASRLLRERGVAAAGKRAGRQTTEGRVAVRMSAGQGTIVAVGCETEPVAHNDEFDAFVERVAAEVERAGPDAIGQLEQERVELVAKLGENVEIRAACRLVVTEDEVVAGYVHPPAQKIGVLVRAKGSQELARELAMHISFANPTYRVRAEVPAEELEAERAIYEKQPELTGKPEQVRGQIVEGMLAKRFFAELVLADQPWFRESSKTVDQVLREQGADLLEFVRYTLA